jgi:hypothetical protein
MPHQLISLKQVDYVNLSPEEIKLRLTQEGVIGIDSVTYSTEESQVIIEALDWTDYTGSRGGDVFQIEELKQHCTLQGEMSAIHPALAGIQGAICVRINKVGTLHSINSYTVIGELEGDLSLIHPKLTNLKYLESVTLFEDGEIAAVTTDSTVGIGGPFKDLHPELGRYEEVHEVFFHPNGTIKAVSIS